MRIWETVRDLSDGAEALACRRYGCVEMRDAQLRAIHLRPWERLVSQPEVWLGQWWHGRRSGNRCYLYYNQPRGCPNYLSLAYIVSTREGSLGSFYGALCVLDEIARIKRTDAIVCEAFNERISDRLLARWGWERHLPKSPRRHFIKRFYGVYPQPREVKEGVRSFAERKAVMESSASG